MITLTLDVNNSYLQELKAFGPRLQTVFMRGINKGIRGVKTDAVKEIRKTYSVKASGLRKRLDVSLAGKDRLSGSLYADKAPTPLILFGALPNKPEAKRPKKGVSVKVKKQRKRVSDTFVARMPSGHIGVFHRKGDDPYPIVQNVGPAPNQMFNNWRVFSVVKRGAVSRTIAEIQHGINKEIEKVNRKTA